MHFGGIMVVISIRHYKKARAICNLVGMTDMISVYTANMEAKNNYQNISIKAASICHRK